MCVLVQRVCGHPHSALACSFSGREGHSSRRSKEAFNAEAMAFLRSRREHICLQRRRHLGTESECVRWAGAAVLAITQARGQPLGHLK
jgi:hypothetical protein